MRRVIKKCATNASKNTTRPGRGLRVTAIKVLRNRTTRQSSLLRRPDPSRRGDFLTEHAPLARARNAAPPGRTRDIITFGCSAGILVLEDSGDRQKSSLPAPEKQNRSGWLKRKFQPPLADLPDKAD